MKKMLPQIVKYVFIIDLTLITLRSVDKNCSASKFISRPEFFTNFAGLFQVVDEVENCTVECTTTDSLTQNKPFSIAQKDFIKTTKFPVY